MTTAVAVRASTIRWCRVDRLVVGDRLTREVPDPAGGYGDYIEVEPTAVTDISPYHDGRLHVFLDCGINLAWPRNHRVAVAVPTEGDKA